MARIVFLPLPEAGHIHATFGLAKQLASRGHELVYMAPPDGEPFLRERPWPFIPLYEEAMPRGRQAELDAQLAAPGLSPRARKDIIREVLHRHGLRITEALFGATMEARLREVRADLFLVDATFPLPVLAAHKLGVPAYQLCTNLALNRDVAVPPLSSHHVPTGTVGSRLGIRLAWQWQYLRTFLPFEEKMRDRIRAFYRLHPGAPPASFNTHLQIGPHFQVPTLVMSAPEFDFRRSSADVHYLGPCVDLDRTEPPLPTASPPGDAPHILCSLGSHGDRLRGHQPFFQSVISAVARRPQLRLLMAVGKEVRTDAFGPLPPNVTVTNWVPQLTALKQSSLMITHGGLNSVKECICLGVPMLVYPLMFDQPGNAARVVHHGLGLRGNIRETSAEQVGAQLDQLLGTPTFQARIRAMQRIFRDADAASQGAVTLERLLQGQRLAA
ncbi:glycosyltransferase [Corallococcus sp. EGB]|uniref:glycosyltransferase n=1 Tax=Corallococcus sp. EGB TaxID=1521117 RepID=UPI001CBF2330|nr:glycosyltransferase [Corallococcus sp. EGB]